MLTVIRIPLSLQPKKRIKWQTIQQLRKMCVRALNVMSVTATMAKQPVMLFVISGLLKAKKEASDKLPEVASMIDRLAKRGTIHKNKAANLKRKLAKKVNALAK